MKKALFWTAMTAAAGAGAVLVYGWVQRARTGVAHGLEQAERVTAATKKSLEETETSLREARGVIS